MPAPRSISTRKGDDGTTAMLFGRRVSKADARVCAYGAMDELSAAIGMARCEIGDVAENERIENLQHALLTMGASLAVEEVDRERYEGSKIRKPEEADVEALDAWVAELEAVGVTFEGFTMPGANRTSAAFDVARTVCRRAEREVVRLRQEYTDEGTFVVRYLNRLSDLLWLLARQAEKS